jgi:biopolymer transport protein ExbD
MNNIFDVFALILGIILAIMLKDSGEPEEEPRKQESIRIKIEQIQDIYYAWHENDFVVQSKNIEDVLDHIKQKFPNKNYFIVSNRNLEKWLQTKKI